MNTETKSSDSLEVLLLLLINILEDGAAMCGCPVEKRDISTLSRRCHREGFAFLASTLPRMHDSLIAAVTRGFILSTDFQYFRKDSAKYPCLFRVFFKGVFDDSGQLLDAPDPNCIKVLRQLTLTFKKIKELCSEEKVEKSLQRYVETEREIEEVGVPDEWRSVFDAVTRYWADFDGFNAFEALPHHGPGAVFERAKGDFKFSFLSKKWPLSLWDDFPYEYYCVPSLQVFDSMDIDTVDTSTLKAVFITAVPKTFLKPRLIGIESIATMYCQQAVKEWTYRHIERNNPLTSGCVNFTSQSINRIFAFVGSFDGSWATLDMSDASDRVTLRHVEALFQYAPRYLRALLSCRSEIALVPRSASMLQKGPEQPCDVVDLRKFASMGSACCFPVESLFFFTVGICGIIGKGHHPQYADIKYAADSLRVYGDDIICPREHANAVAQALTDFGGRVNLEKSFTIGKFRESCGMDAYEGNDVTPVYMRKHIPSDPLDPDLSSVVEFSNLLYSKGYWKTAAFLQEIAERILGEQLPVCEKDSFGLHLWSFTGYPGDFGLPHQRLKWDSDLQSVRYRVRALKIKKEQLDPISNAALRLASYVRLETRKRDEEFMTDIEVNLKHVNPHTPRDDYATKDDDATIDSLAGSTLQQRWYTNSIYSPKISPLTAQSKLAVYSRKTEVHSARRCTRAAHARTQTQGKAGKGHTK